MQHRIAIRTALVLATGLTLAAAAPSAHAERRRAYATDKEFGLGVMLGAPSGLTGKYFLDSRVALDFGVGTFREFYYHEGTQLHADVLWHPVLLASTPALAMPLYLGIGGRILEHDDYYGDGRYYVDDTHVGLRLPIGIAFDLRRTPLDIFAELVPVWDFVGTHHYGHDLDLTGAIGLRYYF